WDEIGGFQVIYEENNDDDPTGVDVDDLPNSVVTDVKWSTSGFDTTYVSGVAGGPTRKGYDFAGWFKDAGLTNPYASAEAYKDLVASTSVTSVTLYAKWDVKHSDAGVDYKVVYEENNNDDPSGVDVDDLPNSVVTVVDWLTSGLDTTFVSGVAGGPTRQGYAFAGWFKDAGLTQALASSDTYGGIAGDDTVTTVTLYAKWDELADFIIHYDVNGGNVATTPADRTGVAWTDVDLKPATAPTFAGRHLDGYGWAYRDAAGNLVAISAATAYSEAWTLGQGAGKEVTLYALWADNVYTLHYDSNGGQYADGSTDVPVVVKWSDSGFLTAAPAPTRTGYVLRTTGAWNDRTDGLGTALDDIMDYAALAGGNDTVLDVYVYAQWDPITYVVKFNSNDAAYPTAEAATGAMADQTFTYDVSQALDPNAFARRGYSFAGWNTASDGTGIAYTDAQSVLNLSSTDGDQIELFAIWD
ncbi:MULTISPECIES: InlB B-repeat-containing protein, partial [Atopobiaceae]